MANQQSQSRGGKGRHLPETAVTLSLRRSNVSRICRLDSLTEDVDAQYRLDRTTEGVGHHR